MPKKPAWAKSVFLGHGRFFRRDVEGRLYFRGQKTWYRVSQADAKHILGWLSVYHLLVIGTLGMLFITMILFNTFMSLLFVVAALFLLEFFVRWWLLKWLSRRLSPLEDLPSTAWQQYWSSEVLLMDGLSLMCLQIASVTFIGFGFYSASHGYLWFGTLTILFFVGISLWGIYRLLRIINFKKNQTAGGM